MALELEQLTRVIGSEIHGIDLNHVDAAMAAKIKIVLNERLVLVFRDQSLTRETHKSSLASSAPANSSAMRCQGPGIQRSSM